MRVISLTSLLAVLFVGSASAFAPSARRLPITKSSRVAPRGPAPIKAFGDAAAASVAAAALLSSNVATAPVQNYVSTFENAPMAVSATYVRREGFYKDYEVEVKEQDVDDAKSTFKSAKATAKGKNKYVGVLGVLIVGSFIIPMLQYFWYVRED